MSVENSSSIGPPRMDPYLRVLHRFYEPLILLKQLAPYDGDYVLVHPRAGTLKAIRRQFIKNLAYICDSRKGGETTTAIGLEQQDESSCFWIAQNASVSDQTRVFLEKALDMLMDIRALGVDGARRTVAMRLLKHCTEFSRRRIGKERGLLLKALRSCIERNIEDHQIVLLLQKLEDCTQPLLVCKLAFQARHLNLQHITTNAIHLSSSEYSADGLIFHIANTRHRIGRLAHHIRVVKQLIEDSQYLAPILDNRSVACVPSMLSSPPLSEDSHTTINGVIGRMLHKNDPKFEAFKRLMESLNQNFGIFDEFLGCYKLKTWKPRVHCEIQVLEHFYKERLIYSGDDRYIGCSKLSCLCCRLYFRHHPARCIEPESHQKVYLNWGLPLIAGGARDSGFVAQRTIINAMNASIRELVIEELSRKYEQQQPRADSITDISSTIGSLRIF